MAGAEFGQVATIEAFDGDMKHAHSSTQRGACGGRRK
jgi:hypothetical protein